MSDKGDSPRRHGSADQDINEDFKAFVGGISWQISDRELKDKFRDYDAIGARVQLDRLTGRSRGFGFVMFADEKGLKTAIAAMHGSEVDGRKISVTRAVPQSETVPGTPAAALNAGRRGSHGGYSDRRGPPAGYGGYERRGPPGGYGPPPRGGYGGYPPEPRGYGGPPPRGYDDRGYGYASERSYGYDRAPPDPYAGGYGREAGYSRDPYDRWGGGGGYGADPYDRTGGYGPPGGSMERGYGGGSDRGGYPDRYGSDMHGGSGAGSYGADRGGYRASADRYAGGSSRPYERTGGSGRPSAPGPR